MTRCIYAMQAVPLPPPHSHHGQQPSQPEHILHLIKTAEKIIICLAIDSNHRSTMAKKRKRSKVAQGTPKASQPWSNEEKATLYGWLDYCVEVLGYGKEDFLSTVCIKLEDQGSSRHDINIIVRKLRRDWQSYGPEEQDHGNEEQKFEEIFERGSLCFTGFSAQEHENIATAKRQFVHESTTTTPAKRLLRDRSSNHLRSVSRTPVQSSHKGTPTLFKRENRSQGSTSLATYDRDQTSWEASIKAPRELKPVIKPDKRPAPQVDNVSFYN